MIGEQPSAFKSITRKAAKDHKCCECGSEIQKGEEYQYSSGIWDGQADSFKQCIGCHRIMQAVSSNNEWDEGPSFEGLREFILEEFFEPAKDFLTQTAEQLEITEENLNRLLKLEHVQSCGMQHGTIECRGDGYLWDADHDGYDPDDKSMPCPQCNTLAFLVGAKAQAEETSYYSDMSSSGSGVTIWENAVKTAQYWNEEGVSKALEAVGVVEALYDDPNDESRVLTKVFTY